MSESDYPFPEEMKEYYVAVRWVPDQGWCGVQRLLFHWTLHYGIDSFGYAGRYCFQQVGDAVASLEAWDGTGDPPGRWHKHPDTGTCRDPDTGETWHESVPRPRKGSVMDENEAHIGGTGLMQDPVHYQEG